MGDKICKAGYESFILLKTYRLLPLSSQVPFRLEKKTTTCNIRIHILSWKGNYNTSYEWRMLLTICMSAPYIVKKAKGKKDNLTDEAYYVCR